MKLPKSVLLVDDDKVIRSIYSNVLKKMGIEKVVTAKDGESGFKKYAGISFDFVILDIQMPRMDGLEVLKKIMEINPGATVLMHTSNTNRLLVEECIEHGAYSYVLKTENVLDFKEKVTDIFSRKKVYWQLSRSSPARLTAALEGDFEEPEDETIELLIEPRDEAVDEVVEEEKIITKKKPSPWAAKIEETLEDENLGN